MKRKIVINVPVLCEKDKSKAMKIAVEIKGVTSVSVGEKKDRLEVIGEDVDSVCLAKSLRKKFCCADIISVEEIKPPKPPAPTPPKPQDPCHGQKKPADPCKPKCPESSPRPCPPPCKPKCSEPSPPRPCRPPCPPQYPPCSYPPPCPPIYSECRVYDDAGPPPCSIL